MVKKSGVVSNKGTGGRKEEITEEKKGYLKNGKTLFVPSFDNRAG